MICIALMCWSLLLESRALYSPATLPGCSDTVFMGGWRTNADIGPDKIYRMKVSTGALEVVLERPDAHVNDPSIIRPPSTSGWDRTGWAFMYYTGLYNWDAPLQAWDRHWIGLASSGDGGRTWFDHGPILRGWSPSALVVGNEIWLYYHDHHAVPWRVRLDANGWQTLAAAEPLTGAGLLSNVDVSGSGGVFTLVANTPDLTGLVAGVSFDGLHFVVGPFLSSEAGMLITPHVGADGVLYAGQADEMFGSPTRVLTNRRLSLLSSESVPAGSPRC